jgi:hypothetical protein
VGRSFSQTLPERLRLEPVPRKQRPRDPTLSL